MPKKSTKRTALKTSINSTQGARSTEQFDAERSWRSLEARVKHLELLISRLDTDDFESPQHIRVGKLLKKRGPKTIPDFELANRRDELIAFFESSWPELEPLCTTFPDMKALRQAFQAFAAPGQSKTPWRTQVAFVAPGIMGNHSAAVARLLLPKTFSQLEVFLREQQQRFAANPRQLANAMAGCPELTFWTSLKRCQKLPFRFGIDHRAMRAYIRRSHPRLYKKLSERPTLPELAVYWQGNRTKDNNMSGLNAEHLERLWRAGIAISDGR